jgi:kinesin family member 17
LKIRCRLKEIEGNLVGGERANDKEFQERRWKKKTQAERRMALLAQLLAKTRDEDGSLLRVYDDIQQEIRVKSEVIKKYKAKVRLIRRLESSLSKLKLIELN